MFQNRVIYLIFISHKVSCGAEPREEKIRTYSSIHEYFWILRFLMYSDLEYSVSWCIQTSNTQVPDVFNVILRIQDAPCLSQLSILSTLGHCRHALDSRRTWCLSKVAVELSNLLSLYCRILSYTVELSYCRYCRTVAILSTTVEHYCRTVEPGLWG